MTRACVVITALPVSSRTGGSLLDDEEDRAVAPYGEAAVESWAMSKRIPERGIEKARRCLK
jgi:hypothetical protein